MADELDPDEIDALIAQQAAEAAGDDDATDAEIVAEDATDEAPQAALDEAPAEAPFSAADIAELLGHEGGAGETPSGSRMVVHEPLIEEVSFAELPPVHAPIDQLADIDLLLDVPLQITVELGQAKRTIRELLELGQGSILHLTRHAGEPVDVLVNGQHIARGEVVVIDENFGIRVTEVVSPADRLRTMAA
jgi:flagellar motor switch protein FliN/FliY